MKSLQKVYLHPGNAVLVIVDMENEFLKPGGKRYDAIKAQVGPQIIPAIRGLAERARRAGVPVIYIQSVRTLKEPEFTVFGRDPHLEINTWATEIVEELKPQKGDTVVQKFSHDPFYQTKLDEVLKKLVPDPTKCFAVVTGGAVNVCAYHATMGFYLRNYWTVVPVDCVYYSTESGKDHALAQFSLAGYPSIFLSRSDLIEISPKPVSQLMPLPGT